MILTQEKRKGICLIYNDISKRDGATADSEHLWGLMNSIPVFGENIIKIERRKELVEEYGRIEDDIIHHLMNFSCNEKIDFVMLYFGCHGTNDQKGEYLQMMGHKVRSWRLAKIYTLVMRVPDLQEKLKDTKFVVYVNACRGSEEESLKTVQFDSLPHEPANLIPSTISAQRFQINPITSDDATRIIEQTNLPILDSNRDIPSIKKPVESPQKGVQENVSMNQYTNDLFSQIFSQIRPDKNTFIHFSTVKNTLSLRSMDRGSLFCNALVTEYRKAIQKGESIDVEQISYRINQALQETKVVRQGFSHECGQVSQIKHRLASSIKITEGKDIMIKGTRPGTSPRVVIVRDKFGAVAAKHYTEVFQSIGYICSELDVSEQQWSFMEILIKSFLPNISQIIFIVIITPENARHGWVIKEGKNGSDDETAEPSKFIKKFSSMAIAIPQLFVIDSWMMKTPKNQCLLDTDEIEQTSESTERIRRRCIPRDTNIFMIFSNSLSDTNLSPFAALFKQTVDQLRELKDEASGTIDTILRKIIQKTPPDSQVPEIQHQGVSKFSLWN